MLKQRIALEGYSHNEVSMQRPHTPYYWLIKVGGLQLIMDNMLWIVTMVLPCTPMQRSAELDTVSWCRPIVGSGNFPIRYRSHAWFHPAFAPVQDASLVIKPSTANLLKYKTMFVWYHFRDSYESSGPAILDMSSLLRMNHKNNTWNSHTSVKQENYKTKSYIN